MNQHSAALITDLADVLLNPSSTLKKTLAVCCVMFKIHSILYLQDHEEDELLGVYSKCGSLSISPAVEEKAHQEYCRKDLSS